MGVRSVLVVGAGFVGREIARELAATGARPILASRHLSGAAHEWLPLDVTDAESCRCAIGAVKPDAVVSVHGPSDITWCETHADAAMNRHRDGAVNLVAAAGRARLVLISTDNVFDGSRERNDEHAETSPVNAYGRAKLAAERVFAAHPDATVLRTSLIYGAQSDRKAERINFAAACARRLAAGHIVRVPHPQWTTPVHVHDVAAVTRAVLDQAPRLLHLGGPDRLTRLDWASRISNHLGASPSLVIPIDKGESQYACRPINSCLSSHVLPNLLSSWQVRVRTVNEGLQTLEGDKK